MSEELLKIDDLSVKVSDKQILLGLNLQIGKGETHVLMGPNGAGKSTLGLTIMGYPLYSVTGGSISFKGEDLLKMDVSERARAGIFLSFQNPYEIPGITLGSFLRSAMEARGEKLTLWKFRKAVKSQMELLQMDESYLDRDLNVGFSGGEKKKAEILQLLMLKPDLAILDETDSGLDVDAVKTVSIGVREFQKNQNGALLIITHSTRILEALKVDHTHVLAGGSIKAEGDGSLVTEINENGFEKYIDR